MAAENMVSTTSSSSGASNSVSPSQADMENWFTVEDMLSWAGFALIPDTADTLLHHLEVMRGDSIAEIGSVPKSEYEEAVSHWSFQKEDKDGELVITKPGIGMISKAKRLGHAARVYSGMEYTAAQQSDIDWRNWEHDKEMERLQATPVSAPAAPPISGEAPRRYQRSVLIKDVADTGRNSDEVPIVSGDFIDELLATYRRLAGSNANPPEEYEPSPEQISVLYAFKQSKENLYVDFNKFGPNGSRTLKKGHEAGLLPDANGVLRKTEFYGPPDFPHYEACFHVFATGCSMLELVASVHLDAYLKYIGDQSRWYGPAAWPIIYQADVRMRREHMETIRREQSLALNQMIANGNTGPFEFDPKKPWDRCFQLAPGRADFWKKYLERPADMVKMANANAAQFIDGDAVIARSSQEHLATSMASHSDLRLPPRQYSEQNPTKRPRIRGGNQPQWQQPPPAPQPYQAPAAPRAAPPATVTKRTGEAKIVNGYYVTNKTGKHLCSQFQHGQCATNCGSVHQCSKCLRDNHGAFSGNPPCNVVPAIPQGGAGAKGKGKHKGKRGKGKRN